MAAEMFSTVFNIEFCWFDKGLYPNAHLSYNMLYGVTFYRYVEEKVDCTIKYAEMLSEHLCKKWRRVFALSTKNRGVRRPNIPTPAHPARRCPG